MSEQAELQFAKSFLNILSSAPVHYADDYQQPLQNWLKRVPILPIELPAPPARTQPEPSTSTASLTITFKSLKPPKSYTIGLQPTDSISSIKSQLSEQPGAPPADAQRLLLKGKALADSKLLKEYNIKDGDTVNLMVKPGYDWDPSKTSIPTISEPKGVDMAPNSQMKSRMGHGRVPSVVLSPSPSGSFGEEKPVDILLTLDTSAIPTPSMSPEASSSSYHDTISQPAFWEHLLDFLRTEFRNYDDAATAWEDFLRASKGTLTPSQIAKIRDHVGVVGMAGT